MGAPRLHYCDPRGNRPRKRRCAAGSARDSAPLRARARAALPMGRRRFARPPFGPVPPGAAHERVGGAGAARALPRSAGELTAQPRPGAGKNAARAAATASGSVVLSLRARSAGAGAGRRGAADGTTTLGAVRVRLRSAVRRDARARWAALPSRARYHCRTGIGRGSGAGGPARRSHVGTRPSRPGATRERAWFRRRRARALLRRPTQESAAEAVLRGR